jgi:predicted TIM-barrel fold metal-dependent hydrolase
MPAWTAIIDADAHIIEREQDIRPYLQPPFDRRSGALLPGDQPWDQGLNGTLGFSNPRYEPVPGVRYVGGMSPAEQVDAWHGIMDWGNFEHAVCFPTTSGTVTRLREPEWQVAVARAINDHLAHEYNARSKRVHCVGVLPLGVPEEAAKELRRAVTELGFIGFELLTMSAPRPFGDRWYDPVYAEAEKLGAALCVHGGRTSSQEVGGGLLNTFSEVHCYTFPAGMLLHFTSVVCQGVHVRFPKLRMCFLEIGATWLPYYLDRLDEHWEKRGEADTPLLTRKPSQTVRESNLYFSLESGETLLAPTIEAIGAEHFMYASDVPHWDNEFPRSLEKLWEHPQLSDAAKRAILHDSAAAMYGLDRR